MSSGQPDDPQMVSGPLVSGPVVADTLRRGASGVVWQTSRVAVVVLGMHRSGTSALARLFSLLGCALPSHLLGANDTQVHGHWESDAIRAFNDEVLAAAGRGWNDWLAIDAGWYASPIGADFIARGVTLVEAEFSAAPMIVLKDPRICRLWPLWHAILVRTGYAPRIIMPLRNPLEVAKSLHVRDGFDQAYSSLLWLRHVLDAESATRGLPRLVSSYGELLDEWVRLVDRAQQAWGMVLPRSGPQVADEVENFLQSSARHHVVRDHALIGNPGISQWIRQTFDILRSWSLEGENPLAHAQLDRIRAELDGAAPAFDRLVLHGQHDRARLHELEKTLERERHAREEAAQVLRLREEQRDRLAQDYALSSAEVERLREAQEGITHERLEHQATQNLLWQYEEQQAQITQDLAQLKLDLESAQSAKAQLQADLHRHEAQLTLHMADHQQRHDEMHAALGLLQDENGKLLAENASATGLAAQETARAQALSAALHARETQIADLTSELAKQTSALEQSQAQFAQALAERDAQIAAQMAAEISTHQQLTSVQAEHIADLTGELATKASALEQSQAQFAQAMVEHEAQIAAELSERQQLCAVNTNLEHQLHAALEHHARLESAMRAAEAAHHESLAKASATQWQKIGEIQGELAGLRAENSQRSAKQQQQLWDLQEAQESLLAQLKTSQASLQSAALEKNQLETQILAQAKALNTSALSQEKLQHDLAQAAGHNAALTAELAQLNAQLHAAHTAARTSESRQNYIARVQKVILNCPRWWGIVPHTWQLRWIYGRLARRGIFNADAYLAQNPDVAAADYEPLRHVLNHGIYEGRLA